MFFIYIQSKTMSLPNGRAAGNSRLPKPVMEAYSMILICFTCKNQYCLVLGIWRAGNPVYLLLHPVRNFLSESRESNSDYLLPKQAYYHYTTLRKKFRRARSKAYYRYTTARENDEPQSRRLSACPVQFNGVEFVGIYDTPKSFYFTLF